ncbi:MAG: hypothetical protein FWD65_08190 [Coriobacteriia bacterium]|nr:hypothetical protein [Coriobacteriia bacterium]
MAPHGQFSFTPGLYIFSGFFILVAILGVWMMIDTTRKKRRNRKTFHNIPREPLLFYAFCGGLYMVLWLVMFIMLATSGAQSSAGMTLMTVILVAAIFMVVVELAYLLRVVYPKAAKAAGKPGPGKTKKQPVAVAEEPPGEDNFLDQIGEKDKS